MKKNLKLAVSGLAIGASVFASASTAWAYKESIVIGRNQSHSWSDTGVTPGGNWLSATIASLTFSGTLRTFPSAGSGNHAATLFWGCENGYSNGLTNTFPAWWASLKFTATCPAGVRFQSGVAAIDDL